MSFEMKGLDDLKKKVQELEKTEEVSFSELFDQDFMRENTTFASIEEMFEKSGFKIDSPQDFEAVPSNSWDEYVRSNTEFDDWEQMQVAAARRHFDRKIKDVFG